MEFKKNSKIIVASICLAISLGFCVYNIAQCFMLPSEQEASITLEKIKGDLNNSLILENYDEITKTLNRKGFENFLGNFLKEEKNKAEGHSVALYLINFSSATRGLKAINDEYGHLVGDGLPITFANYLKAVFNDERFVFARRGGSVFVVFDTDFHGKEDAVARIKKLKEMWHDTPYKVDENHIINGLALHAFCLPFDATKDNRSAEELIEFVFKSASDITHIAPFAFAFDGDEAPVTGE